MALDRLVIPRRQRELAHERECARNRGNRGARNGPSHERCDRREERDEAKDAVAAIHHVFHQAFGASGVECRERGGREHEREQHDPTERCAGENDGGGLSDCLHGVRV